MDGLTVECEDVVIIKDRLLGNLQDKLFKLGITPYSITKEIAALRPSLLHSHFGQNGFASLPLTKRLKIPHITTFHGFDITVKDISVDNVGMLHNRFRKNISIMQESGTLFIAVSNFIKQKLLSLGFEEKKIVTHYLGIDLDKFKPPLSVTKQEKIVCIARHVEYKGHQYLIDAMQKVNAKFPNAELVIVGNGPLTIELKKRADSLKINCRFTGRLTQEEVRKELETSKVYCQPSVKLENGHEEALALTIVEAQAMGIPAVVFESGGMPEAIVNGKSGYVVPEKDVEALADKISLLLGDSEKWGTFSKEAVIQVTTRHNIKKQQNLLEDLYNLVLSKCEKSQ